MTHSTFTSGRLPHLGVLRFAGPDAASFLQGQLSNDTRRLAESKSLFAAVSSPQGRVLALLHLLPHSSGILAVLPRELVLPTLEGLRKFVFRAKVTIDDVSGTLWVAGRQAVGGNEPGSGDRAPHSYLEQDGVGSAPVDSSGRLWMVGTPDALQRQGLRGETTGADASERGWRLADIRAGLPQVYLATREIFVAQMLNLDRLDGISFSKGCYTGQEIIARTQHLGRIKRRLYRLRLPEGEWRIGHAIRLTDGRAGRLVEVGRSDDGFEALAVLNLESNTVGAGMAGAGGGEVQDGMSASTDPVAALQLPLPYSLS